MLKNSFLNEKLNRRLLFKETPRLINKFFGSFLQEKRKSSPQEIIFWNQLHLYLLYWNKKLMLNSPFARRRTVCFLTGRNRSVYRAFHLSRLKLREFAATGSFIGLSKASW